VRGVLRYVTSFQGCFLRGLKAEAWEKVTEQIIGACWSHAGPRKPPPPPAAVLTKQPSNKWSKLRNAGLAAATADTARASRCVAFDLDVGSTKSSAKLPSCRWSRARSRASDAQPMRLAAWSRARGAVRMLAVGRSSQHLGEDGLLPDRASVRSDGVPDASRHV
jgi:hypothetical protein